MEVLCEQCQTDYDFDDALVSERGTTVKCTNCGHQFRIYRPKTLVGAPERWVVRRGDGREMVFTSLRDLQRAITRAQVGRHDTLTREGLATRKLSAIAELEPFFPYDDDPTTYPRGDPGPMRDRMLTPLGLGGPPPPAIQPPREPETSGLPNVRRATGDDAGFDEATIPRTPVSKEEATAQQYLGEEPGFQPSRPPGQPAHKSPEQAPAAATAAATTELPLRIERSLSSLDVRMSYTDDGMTDPRFVSVAPPRRSAAARVVVGVVLLGALALVGLTIGRRYLVNATTPTSAAAPADARITQLLESGEKELLEGDIEAAKASFDKASVLAERDPHVLRQLAHLANIRADLPWLKLRLLDPDNEDVQELTRLELESRAKQALDASEAAYAAASDDPRAVRTRIDAYRLAGNLGSARRLVPKLGAAAAEPESAYVLAALDLNEAKPNWTTVVDRLRTAVEAERNLGRARGALVYALAMNGQLEAARTELAQLTGRSHPYPLMVELKAYVAGVAQDGGIASTVVDVGAVDPTALPLATAKAPEPPEAAQRVAGAVPAEGSYQEMLKRAHDARRAGNLFEAEHLYRMVLKKHPGDTEALAGLGDIAKERGDRSTSVDYYEEVARQNPSYVPALMGLADAKWDAGDHAGAVALYQRVVQATGGQGTYGQRARQRLGEASAASKARDATSPPPKQTAAEEPPAPPTSTEPAAPPPAPPGVDTSDLPGWTP